MDNKLELSIQTIFDALTTVWENNGNVLADAVRDHVILNLSKISGLPMDEIEKRIEALVENAQG